MTTTDPAAEVETRLDIIRLAREIATREDDMAALLHKAGLIDDAEQDRMREDARFRANQAKRLAITPVADVQANTGLHRRRALAELGED